MNNTEIDILIAARNRLTNRRDEQIDFAAVDNIDALLSTCKPGRRNDVDLLLGRTCATLQPQPVYDAASHYDTITQRHAVLAPDVDLFDMRDMTGTNVMPMTVEERSWLHLLNDDNGMMGDRG